MRRARRYPPLHACDGAAALLQDDDSTRAPLARSLSHPSRSRRVSAVRSTEPQGAKGTYGPASQKLSPDLAGHSQGIQRTASVLALVHEPVSSRHDGGARAMMEAEPATCTAPAAESYAARVVMIL